jgi:hypothetical protein
MNVMFQVIGPVLVSLGLIASFTSRPPVKKDYKLSNEHEDVVSVVQDLLNG